MEVCKYCDSITNSCNDIEAETCENNVEEVINEVTAKEKEIYDVIAAAKAYIKLPLNKKMDEEERYYNPRVKEYDAFLAGVNFTKGLLHL